MKCQSCTQTIGGCSYIVSRCHLPYSLLTVNLCNRCVEATIGELAQSRLDRELARAGWSERVNNELKSFAT